MSARFGKVVIAAIVALLGASAGALGCGGADDSFGLIGGEKIDATLLDRDPIALLPSGIVMLGYIDLAEMFQTKWGPEASQVIANILPLGPESNFSAQRDVKRAYGGVYAMQGADFCAIVQGTFDVDAIGRAADARVITVAGAPLVKSRYAGNDMFTAGNIGFVVLTGHTVLTGNETGMRRALDRLRRGKLERAVPASMIDLTLTKGASMALAGDLASQQPAVDAAASKLPFLAGLRTLRVIGNFKPPGVNFAGALTYADPPAAQGAAVSLQHFQQLAQVISMFTSIGIGSALPALVIAQKESDVAFTLPIEENLVRLLAQAAVTATRPGVMGSGAAWAAGPR